MDYWVDGPSVEPYLCIDYVWKCLVSVRLCLVFLVFSFCFLLSASVLGL